MWTKTKQKIINKLVRSLAGTRTTDGGARGTLARCDKCHGQGILFTMDSDLIKNLTFKEPTSDDLSEFNEKIVQARRNVDRFNELIHSGLDHNADDDSVEPQDEPQRDHE